MHFDKATRWLTLALMLFLTVGGVSLAVAEPAAQGQEAQPGGASPEAIEFFETHIRPVLVEKCFSCHSADAKVLKGNLRLDTAERLRAGGESGPIVVPNKPGESPLISALKGETNEMPPDGQLPDSIIRDFEKWISMGAPDPRSEDKEKQSHDEKADPREHWAYKPPHKSPAPTIPNESAVRDDIDRFIIGKLESVGLSPSPQATPRALLRRVYYDLVGIPPSAEELDEFSADASDARYEATIDRLLASPRFGERWARHWLDVARYSDTKGYVFEEDRNYKGAFAYRDWVIASFNADRPFDKFIVAQIAGDQIGDPACAPATGFLTLGRRFLNVPPDIYNDRIDVVTRGVMGLTVACARCHDHKYDPITAADYYALYGVFASSSEKPHDDAPPEMVDAEKPVDPYVFLRGNPGNRGPNVERRFLACLTPDNKPHAFQHGSGRKELAEAIVNRDNPLTARVWVNRVWDHLLGKGIVDTTSDFGVRGTPPTHPELLDSLACDFMDDGWSTKRLVRRIMLSATYRQSSEVRQDGVAKDPDNHLHWHANRRRLDLESLRDSLLVVAGRLDEKMGGPSVSITDPPFSTRRSVYGFIERQNLPAFFRTFDFANPNTHTPDRPFTTAPQQALFLMNSDFAIEQASFLATRSEQSPSSGGAAGVNPKVSEPGAGKLPINEVRRVIRLFRCALGREPSIDELTDSLEFVDRGEPQQAAKINHQLAWQYGFGIYDDAAKTVHFQALPRFVGNAWQGGEKLPDPALSWVALIADGGHPGDAAHAAIRRWIAPAAGTIRIEGVLGHPGEKGDGIRGRIVASRAGVLGSWDVFHKDEVTNVPSVAVEAGDTIDFITDPRATVDTDSFAWTVTMRLKTSDTEPEQVWNSVKDFHGRIAVPLNRWQELAQVLMMSNEFVFLD